MATIQPDAKDPEVPLPRLSKKKNRDTGFDDPFKTVIIFALKVCAVGGALKGLSMLVGLEGPIISAIVDTISAFIFCFGFVILSVVPIAYAALSGHNTPPPKKRA